MADFSPFHNFPLLVDQILMQESGMDVLEVMPFPPVNICRDRRAVYLQVLLPGADKESVIVAPRGTTLVLEGHVSAPSGVFIRQERHSGGFRRHIPLPCPVEGEAQLEWGSGVLNIALDITPGACISLAVADDRDARPGEERLPRRQRVRPAIDILETGQGGFEVLFNVPGVRGEDAGVDVSGNEIGIRALSSCWEEARRRWRACNVEGLEFVDCEYSARVALPEPCEGRAVTASIRDGVLVLRVPCDGATRRIPVRAK